MKYPIFRNIPLVEQSFMQRLLRQYPEGNAIIELNNLLVNKDIQELKSEDISYLSNKYKLNLLDKFHLNLEEFYAVVLNYSLKDKNLSKEELNDLYHLKNIFQLNDSNVYNIHLKIGQSIYHKSFEQAILDGRLTNEKISFLENLAVTLKLPKNITDEISLNIKQAFFENSYNNFIRNNRLSPYEEEEILAIANNLDIKITQKDKNKLDRLRLYWSYENLPLYQISTTHKLQKNETCYYIEHNANYYEERESLKKRYNYLKVNEKNEIITFNLKFIEFGDILLTNKRLIFIGQTKIYNIEYNKILSVKEFKDSIEIDKLTGRSPIYKVGNCDVITIILNRLIRELN